LQFVTGIFYWAKIIKNIYPPFWGKNWGLTTVIVRYEIVASLYLQLIVRPWLYLMLVDKQGLGRPVDLNKFAG
jgi:hypothetical protein